MKILAPLFMVVFLFPYCMAQNEHEASDHNQSPATNQANSSPIEPSVSQQESNNRNNEKQQDSYSSRGELSASDIVNCISTAVIAVFTIVLAIYTILLWKSGEKHSERELRAYVSIIPGRALIVKDKPQISGVECLVKNHGRTPAFEINFLYGISILPIGAELPTATGKISENAAVFPEAHIHTRFVKHPFTSEETTQVMKGTHRLHFWGYATYRDAFGRRRITRFSAFLGGQDFANNFRAVQEGKPLPPTFRWTFADRHNDAT